ncbi:MAG: DUF6624 domain-containing protein [Acidimicrobiales bacterium]
MARPAAMIAALCLTTGLGACGGDGDGDGPAADEDAPHVEQDAQLRRELLDMMEADQTERTGESTVNNDEARTDRLREIIDEHGWPTFDLVGRDGATAAWLVAQHADFDVEFQAEALELMRAALDGGQTDPTEVAYLEDRVAVNRGEPQRYGTQVRCRDGEPTPATPRAEVGMRPETLAEYYEDFAEGCAAEG